MINMMGRILFVDLGASTFEERALSETVYKKYLGGIGLAARILLDEIPAGADPLGPDNILAFMTGALTCTGSLVTGRWMVACKSPLTGGWGDANCGGNFSPAIKQCGYDGIFFKGISPDPVIFICDEHGPRLESAADLWGMDAIEAEYAIKTKWKGQKKPAVAVIGYAAEKLSLISGISNDSGRYAARSGVGAVMGSKHLKALVLAGNKKIGCANPEKMLELSSRFSERVKKSTVPKFVSYKQLDLLGKMLGLPVVVRLNGILSTAFFKKWGTIYNNTGGIVNGDTPIKNWAGSVKDFPKENYDHINAHWVTDRETKKYFCYSCVIGCGGICDVSGIAGLSEDQRSGARHSHKPEYETHAAFGPMCLNDDENSIFICNDICNRSGLDTISAGSTIAFAIECRERGILTEEQCEGLNLKWGNSEAIVQLLKKMANREGIGQVFADGIKKAAERLSALTGKDVSEYAIHAGGQEPGMHDSRMDPLMGVAFSADPTPGRHTIAADVYYNVMRLWNKVSWAPAVPLMYLKKNEYAATTEEARKAVASTLYKQVADMAGGCLFAMITGVQNWDLFEMFNAATGLRCSPDEYMEFGRRAQTLRQLFNLKHGIKPAENFIPLRIQGTPPLPAGPLRGKHVPIPDMVSLYWREMGWDEHSGVPLKTTLERLGL